MEKNSSTKKYYILASYFEKRRENREISTVRGQKTECNKDYFLIGINDNNKGRKLYGKRGDQLTSLK